VFSGAGNTTMPNNGSNSSSCCNKEAQPTSLQLTQGVTPAAPPTPRPPQPSLTRHCATPP
jgi:hypothetical protein